MLSSSLGLGVLFYRMGIIIAMISQGRSEDETS